MHYLLDCIDLIQKILQHDANCRPTIPEILRHSWFAIKPLYAKTRSAPAVRKITLNPPCSIRAFLHFPKRSYG
jgi:serine/threonine protein kinase